MALPREDLDHYVPPESMVLLVLEIRKSHKDCDRVSTLDA